MTLDDMLTPAPPESARTVVPSKPRRHRHVWIARYAADNLGFVVTGLGDACLDCGKHRDPAASRRGRNNRSRGNRHELAVARRYGGEKVGPLGGPEDVRGRDWRSQVKTHQGLPPARWRAIFGALDTQHDGRLPRLIERYLPGQGIPPEDYIVIRGADWLAWYGKDEEERDGD